MIDLRSDTVTKPDKSIIEEALEAELGDDEYGEDPTVNQLQEKCAELLGFESGLFVSSGLMGNQISLLIHNSPGTEVITTSDSHIKNYEHGAASFLSRVQFREINHKDGALNLDTIKSVYEKSKVHKPQIKTIAQENTHLASGGSIVSYSHLAEVYSYAKEVGLNVHIDGARVWHAILGEGSPTNYGNISDSLTFCFSKALGAPVGSMLLGTKNFITQAREYRKILGGGMRQVGVIASMANKSLDLRERILDDHQKASDIFDFINKELESNSFFTVNYKNTNMIFLKFHDGNNSQNFIKKLEKEGVLSGLINNKTVRLVFHKDVSTDDLVHVREAIYSSSEI